MNLKLGKKQLEGVAMMVGTIVGAGILGLPYAISQIGLLPGIILIAILGLVLVIVNLFFGEVTLRTKELHQIPGYADIFLGKWAKYIFSFSMAFTIYGALTAYLVGMPQVLTTMFAGESFYWLLGFWALASFLIFVGVEGIKKVESWMFVAIVGVILLIGGYSVPHMSFPDLMMIRPDGLFAAYGVILFSFLGFFAVPQVRQLLIGEEETMPITIILGSLAPAVIYILFIIIVLGVTGSDTTEIATIGLGSTLGQHMVILGNLFAFLTMGTSYLALGLSLRHFYEYDLHIPKLLSSALVTVIPLLIILLGASSFIGILGLVGGVVGGIEGIMLILMYWAAQGHGDRKSEYDLLPHTTIGVLIIFMFILGILYTIL